MAKIVKTLKQHKILKSDIQDNIWVFLMWQVEIKINKKKTNYSFEKECGYWHRFSQGSSVREQRD